MKKALAAIFLLLVIFCSCEESEKFVAPSGEYILKCEISGVCYQIKVDLSENATGTLRFENGAMSDWYFRRDPDGKTKCFTSLGEEIEVKHENIDKIFDFISLSYENIADVSHDNISGRDVSILKLSGGSLVYTDSLSGEPLKLISGNLTIDIISRPQT